MKTNEETLNLVKLVKYFEQSPFIQGVKCYAKWKGDLSFRDDLFDYLMTGFVVSRPSFFWMAKIILHDNTPCWFVRFAAGDLKEMLETLPCYLSKIAFCRRNGGKMRVYKTDRFLKLIMNRSKREE